MFYEEWGLERALWEETHKGAYSAAASKKNLFLRLLLVLKILILVFCNRHRWTGNKRNLAVTAVHLSGLAVRGFEWQNRGFLGMWASETGKGRTPQEEVMPFSQPNWAHQREPKTLGIFPPPSQQSQCIPELHTMQNWPYFSLSSEAKKLIESASPTRGREFFTWITQ